MTSPTHALKTFSAPILKRAVLDSFAKLDPRVQWKNPVMFVVLVGSALTTLLWLQNAFFGAPGKESAGFILHVTLWLWFTVLFANFAESVAEGRGKAQAAALRGTRRDVMAKKLADPAKRAAWSKVAGSTLRKGDVVLVEAGDVVPADGEVIEGAATVNESAITGESAPVVRESGGDRSSVTGGTSVLSDWLVVRVTANPGETFLDRMIGLVEGAKRQRTPNEIALSVLLAKFTLIFLLACGTLLPFSVYAVKATGQGQAASITVLVALLVCLIPTTIGGLLSAIGIAGMDRLIRANVIATATSACASAGASLVPSPHIATRRPPSWCPRMSLSFASGVASARKSSTPDSAAMAAAVSRLSPVIITVRMPMRRSSAKRSLMPPLTMSLSSITPRTRTLPAARSATTSGVAPRRDTVSTSCCTSSA